MIGAAVRRGVCGIVGTFTTVDHDAVAVGVLLRPPPPEWCLYPPPGLKLADPIRHELGRGPTLAAAKAAAHRKACGR